MLQNVAGSGECHFGGYVWGLESSGELSAGVIQRWDGLWVDRDSEEKPLLLFISKDDNGEDSLTDDGVLLMEKIAMANS